MVKNKTEKEIIPTISQRYTQTIEKRKSLRIYRGFESWIVNTISKSIRPEKLSKKNIKTHDFSPTNQEAISGNELKCSKCNMIVENKKGTIYAYKNLSCNEYIMNQVIE